MIRTFEKHIVCGWCWRSWWWQDSLSGLKWGRCIDANQQCFRKNIWGFYCLHYQWLSVCVCQIRCTNLTAMTWSRMKCSISDYLAPPTILPNPIPIYAKILLSFATNQTLLYSSLNAILISLNYEALTCYSGQNYGLCSRSGHYCWGCNPVGHWMWRTRQDFIRLKMNKISISLVWEMCIYASMNLRSIYVRGSLRRGDSFYEIEAFFMQKQSQAIKYNLL